jgi:hypothetical protein
MMMSPLNNVFNFRNAHTCLQCAAYQARGGINFPQQMMLAFRMQKPTANESGECVVRGIPGFNMFTMHQWTKIAQAVKEHNMRVSKGNVLTQILC